MFLVRYAALLALAIWVGGMLAMLWLGAAPPRTQILFRQLAYPCGGVMLLSLFVQKFVGPPPRAFPLRAALTAAMLALVAYADITRGSSELPPALAVLVGLGLMTWYARE